MHRDIGRLALLLRASTSVAFAQPGALVIVGGGTQPSALVDEFVRLAGGPARARIAVLAMASASGERSGEAKAADLRARGARADNRWVTRETADQDSVVALLDSVTGVWFGGGDQSRLADVLRGTKLERAIRARHAAGAVIGGTSAGAAVLSAVMITGRELRSTVNADTTQDWTAVAAGSVETTDGFGYVREAIIDQHFLRRRRHNRLLSLVLERKEHLGLGIDEGTAVIVEPDGRWRIAGTSVVVIYDARRAALTAPAHRLGVSGMTMHLLPAGSVFDPRTGVATLP
jgi:cyanophycinase